MRKPVCGFLCIYALNKRWISSLIRILISSEYIFINNAISQVNTLKSFEMVVSGVKPIHSMNVLGKENSFFMAVNGLKEFLRS